MGRWYSIPREYPDYPMVGVGAVVIVNGKILLVKRASPPGRGRWSIPGGVPEVGEKLKDAVLRELYEETGVRGRVLGLIDVEEYIEYDKEDKVRYHYVLLDFLVEPIGEVEPKASSDALEARFWSIEYALKSLELTISTRKLLAKIKRYRDKPILLEVP